MNEEIPSGATPTMLANQMVGDLLKTFGGAPAQPVVPQPAPQVQPVMPPAEQPPIPAPGPTQDPPPPAAEPTALPEQPLTEEDKRAHAFATLRYENKQLTSQVSDLQKALEAEQAKNAEEARKYQEINQQLDEERRARVSVEDTLGRTNLAESKEFKARFDDKHDDVVRRLTEIIVDKTETTDPKKAEDFARGMLAAQDDEVLHAVDRLPSYVQGSIYNLVQEGRRISAERTEALEQWRTTQTGLTEAAARQRAADLSIRRQELADRAVAAISGAEYIPALYITEPEFVAARNKRLEDARAFVRTATEDDLANAAVEGILAPMNYELLEILRKENERLQGQLDAMMRTSSPMLRATPGSAPAPAKPAEPLRPATPSTHQMAVDTLGTLFRKLS